MLTWKRSTNRLINGKCNLTLIPINKQLKLCFLGSLFHITYPPIKFNERIITKCNHGKHLGITLDSNLNFNTHIDQKIRKCNELIGLLRRLSLNLP